MEPFPFDLGPFVIAEAGVNHNGSLDRAKELVDVAADSGADAVKFQTFSADRLVSRDANTADYQKETADEGNQYEMLKRHELDRSAHEELRSHCAERDVEFLSTPFEAESADLLAELDLSAIKVGSGELDNHPLLKHIAGLGIPMIVSTGMGTMEEVRAAREAIREAGPDLAVAFLHCTSAYPCPSNEVNLRAMRTMAEALPEPIGYSDHTTRTETPGLAVTAGAEIVEKHFTIDSSLPGPDHEASLEPDELAEAVELVRAAAPMRGSREKSPTPSERENVEHIRKSLHATSDLPSGTRLEPDHLEALRPATGISPRYYERVLGATTTAFAAAGEPLTEADITESVGDSD